MPHRDSIRREKGPSDADPLTDVPIEIVAHDPRWAEAFARERDVIARHLAPWLSGRPEHIGSTAVDGLGAKPIIDIMAPVVSLQGSRDAIAAAERIGYVYFPYKADQMHWFCRPAPSHRTHHLHLVRVDSPLWCDRLVFRDALREDASLRNRYEALKLSLAAVHRDDREAYTAAKGPFIESVLHDLRATGSRMPFAAVAQGTIVLLPQK